jgi:phytoene dehydrogenase-like protein
MVRRDDCSQVPLQTADLRQWNQDDVQSMKTKPVIIVGGGLAGLNCARHLHSRNVEFRLLEAGDRFGGRVSTTTHEGFRLETGFQVLLTSYSEARTSFDYEKLRLGFFQPGALVRHNGRFCRFADPWRKPAHTLATLFSPVATLADKWRIARLRARVCRGSADDLSQVPDIATGEYLVQLGFSERVIESFFRPFMGGVFLERDLATSARKFAYLFRMFSTGDAALPAGGMENLCHQLVARLPSAWLRTGARVEAVEANKVALESGECLEASSVIVACDPWNAARLLHETEERPSNSASVFYFSADTSPVIEPVLVLNGEGSGPINSVCVPSQVAAGYAPPGKSLISVAVTADFPLPSEAAVRDQLVDWYGEQANRWDFLKAIRVNYALPRQLSLPGNLPNTAAVARKDRIIICGDYMDVASIQGALRSGRLAAEWVLERNGALKSAAAL